MQTASVTKVRPFRSNKNMIKRVFSQDSNLSKEYQNVLRRPSTAANGPTMMQAKGAFRRPLASNSILHYNAQARSFNRHFLYNK